MLVYVSVFTNGFPALITLVAAVVDPNKFTEKPDLGDQSSLFVRSEILETPPHVKLTTNPFSRNDEHAASARTP